MYVKSEVVNSVDYFLLFIEVINLSVSKLIMSQLICLYVYSNEHISYSLCQFMRCIIAC